MFNPGPKYVVIGPPGAGAEEQARKIASFYGTVVVRAADAVSAAAKGSDAALAKQAQVNGKFMRARSRRFGATVSLVYPHGFPYSHAVCRC